MVATRTLPGCVYWVALRLHGSRCGWFTTFILGSPRFYAFCYAHHLLRSRLPFMPATHCRTRLFAYAHCRLRTHTRLTVTPTTFTPPILLYMPGFFTRQVADSVLLWFPTTVHLGLRTPAPYAAYGYHVLPFVGFFTQLPLRTCGSRTHIHFTTAGLRTVHTCGCPRYWLLPPAVHVYVAHGCHTGYAPCSSTVLRFVLQHTFGSLRIAVRLPTGYGYVTGSPLVSSTTVYISRLYTHAHYIPHLTVRRSHITVPFGYVAVTFCRGYIPLPHHLGCGWLLARLTRLHRYAPVCLRLRTRLPHCGYAVCRYACRFTFVHGWLGSACHTLPVAVAIPRLPRCRVLHTLRSRLLYGYAVRICSVIHVSVATHPVVPFTRSAFYGSVTHTCGCRLRLRLFGSRLPFTFTRG